MPYIKKLQGIANVLPESMTLVMKNAYGKPSPKQRFVRGRLLVEDGVAYFVENDKQGNGVVSSFIGCDVLAEIPAGSEPIEKGTKVTAYRM
jgi:molybdopterin molybdotransferase